MELAAAFQVYSYGLPARPGDIERLRQTYPHIPAGYLEIVREMTNLVLLWNRHGELRLWGPEHVMAMDRAYGVSVAIPGAMPYADNGGGELLVHGMGSRGLATYLVDTGSLFLDEDAPFVAPHLQGLLATGQGAGLIFKSDQIPVEDTVPPRLEEGEYR